MSDAPVHDMWSTSDLAFTITAEEAQALWALLDRIPFPESKSPNWRIGAIVAGIGRVCGHSEALSLEMLAHPEVQLFAAAVLHLREGTETRSLHHHDH